MASPNSAEIDLRDYVKVIYRRKWYVIAVFLIIVATTAIITFTAPSVYEATAEIMIRQDRVAQGIPAFLGDFNLPFAGGRADLTNHIHLLQSRSTLEQVQELLAADPDFVAARSENIAAPRSEAIAKEASIPNISPPIISVEELRGAIRVGILPESDMIVIYAASHSPAEAMKIANALVATYRQMDRELALASLLNVQEFLGTQIGVVEAALVSSEEELVAFQQEIGLVLEEGLMISKISRIEGMLVEARVELADKRDQLAALNRFLDGIREEFLERLLSEEEGVPILLELHDKIALLHRIKRDIAEWEVERMRYLEEENYAQVRILEQRIINHRRELEETAARQFTLLELVPQFEQLIQTQLDFTLGIIALENRVVILEQMLEQEMATLLEHGIALAGMRREFNIRETVHSILLEEYQKIQIAETAELGSVTIVNAAELPRSPIRPNKRMNLLVAGVLGLFSGVGVAFLRDYTDNTFKSTDDVEQTLDLTPIGNVPRIGVSHKKLIFEQVEETLLPYLSPGSSEFESFMALASNLRFVCPDKEITKLLITSSIPSEGKSTIAANLAFTLAINGDRVLLIDADFRMPVLEKTLHVDGKDLHGLSDLILNESSVEAVVKEIKLEKIPAIWFLPAGSSTPNSVSLLSSARFEQVLERLSEQFDVIIIDSPPINVAVDAPIIASKTDGVIFVVEAGKTRKEETQRATKALEHYDVPILGVVLNKVPARSSAYYNNYNYGGYRR